mmetsp:Transcript_62404/g.140670  ORF Transcript_62404/g.140670 Transcript_62404/m.140670 type:complete len:375 (+) Transcript_62404:72-1196(+)
MPETRDKKFYDRASVIFGRPSLKNPNGQKKKADGPKVSCFDACFGMLLGYPGAGGSSSGSPSYDEPKALSSLPPYSKWEQLPEDMRGGVKVEVCSLPKDNVPGWINQDSTVVCCPIGEDDGSGLAPLLFGVFDGHGRYGHDVSSLVAERLPGHLAAQNNVMKDPKKALTTAIKSVDDDVFNNLASNVEYSGTTGVVVLYDQKTRTLHVANVGDSRAVLGQNSPDAKEPRWDGSALTQDCKPDLDEEKERIELSGGLVGSLLEGGNPVGPARVWEDASRQKPGLAVSRTIGDGCARRIGVIPEPVITKHQLTSGDQFMLIATDGLWDSLDNTEAVRIAGKFARLPHVGLKALMEAVRRKEGDELPDDTTVVFVAF